MQCVNALLLSMPRTAAVDGSADKAAHYRPINWGEFRRKRFEGVLAGALDYS